MTTADLIPQPSGPLSMDQLIGQLADRAQAHVDALAAEIRHRGVDPAGLLDRINAAVITTAADARGLNAIVEEVRAGHTVVEEMFDPFCTTLHSLHRVFTGARGEQFFKPLEEAEKTGNRKLIEYKRKRDAEMERIRAEEEAEETRRLAAERDEYAAELEGEGNVAAAEEVRQEPVRAALPPPPAQKVADGLSINDRWVVDKAQLDKRAFLRWLCANPQYVNLVDCDWKAANDLANSLQENFPAREVCGLYAYKDDRTRRSGRK